MFTLDMRVVSTFPSNFPKLLNYSFENPPADFILNIRGSYQVFSHKRMLTEPY